MKNCKSLVRTFCAEMMKKWHQLCNNSGQLFVMKTFGLEKKEHKGYARNSCLLSKNAFEDTFKTLHKTAFLDT